MLWLLLLAGFLPAAPQAFAQSSSVVADADPSGKSTANPKDAPNAQVSTVIAPTQATILPEALASKPISPLLYGNFIELGLGRQVDGLWSEMLYNRSFEEVPQPPLGYLGWLGRNPEDDLAQEPWWHSGYERPPWLASGEAGKYVWNPNVKYWMRQGMQEAILENHGAAPASFYQNGLYLRAGMTYHFHGQLKSGEIGQFSGPKAAVTIGLYAGNALDKPIVTRPLDVAAAWAGYQCDLPAGDYAGRATFAVTVAGGETLQADALSLMPADNVSGWRADALAAMRRVNPGLIRFPGGCFASTYNWRDAVGPELERMPRPSYPWNDLESNDVGTAEFATVCQMIHAEPMLCVNVMTGHAEDAANWVAYCNAPVTDPFGAMRARHGYPAPFHVHYWELDNEDFRKYSPDEYAARAVEYARLMKAVDPSIKIVLCGYWDLVPGFRQQIAGMLEIAGRDIDLVARREYGAGLRETLPILEDYHRRTGREILLCNTEYFPEGRPVPYLDSAEHREPTAREKNYQHQLIRWGWAQNVARTLFGFRTLGGSVDFTCFNNLANTWGQNAIECPKEDAYVSPNGRVLEFLSRSPARWPVRVETAAPVSDGTGIWACLTQDKRGVVVSLLNEQPAPWRVSVNLAPLGFTGGGSGKLVSLAAPDRTTRISLTTQDLIRQVQQDVAVDAAGAAALEAPPYSVSELVITGAP